MVFTQPSSGAAIADSRFCTTSIQIRPRPTGNATPRNTMPSSTPSVPHIIVTSQPPPKPARMSATGGQTTGWLANVAITRLAPAATPNRTPTNTVPPAATTASFAEYARHREGRWDSTVFHVSQPYSLPATSTPKINASAPANSASPPIALATKSPGSMAASARLTGPD